MPTDAAINPTPSTGRPTIFGGSTVLFYFTAAALSLVVVLKTERAGLLWVLVFWALVLLVINKQIDLQSLSTLVAKSSAVQHGWYDIRRQSQIFFIGFVGAASFLTLGLSIYLLLNRFRKILIALISLTILIFFVVYRSALFHLIDALLNTSFPSLSFSYLLENSGISLIIFNAIWLI